MRNANVPTFHADDPVPPGKKDYSAGLRAHTGSIVRIVRAWVTACMVLGVAFLLCQCHRQSPTPEATPAATPAAISPTPTAVPTITPAPTTSGTETPTVKATPLPSASPPPDPFDEGIKRLLEASENGFLELHGKLKRTENGSGPDPLFRVRKIYEGNFLFEGAALAELEEVYFGPGQQPAYNYQLYYQALSTRASIEKYDDFRQQLNRVLQGFEHTFGDRYDAWARNDARKTAVLLSSQEATGSRQIQFHVAFSSPQW
jgi:hypothetical protein